MAVYKICSSGLAVDSTISISVGTAVSTRNYTDAGGCAVTEKTIILTFTSSEVSDDDFTIWFTYQIQNYLNYDLDGDVEYHTGSVIMEAGNTSVTKEVFSSILTIC